MGGPAAETGRDPAELVGRRLSGPARAVRGALQRVRAARDRILLPEASAGLEQWQRVPLIQAVNRHVEQLGPQHLEAAEISGADHAGKPWKRFESLNYPDFDLCAPLADELRAAYDVVLCEQVIEHVVDPNAAAENLRGLVRPDGHVIVSTPFLIRIHELPMYGMDDYWRFTPRGLRTLLERAGLEVQAVGSWGNRSCVVGNLDHWPAYRRWQSLRNEPDLPVQVWAFARNPG
jgi:SAM-dependent methyltransferase